MGKAVRQYRLFFRRWGLLALALFVVSALVYFWQLRESPMPLQRNTDTDQSLQRVSGIVRTHRDPVISSHIPAYYLMAIRHSLEATPLRRAELMFQKEEDGIDESLVLLDKVIVVPKKFT